MKFFTSLILMLAICSISVSQEDCATQTIHDFLLSNDAEYKLAYETNPVLLNQRIDSGQIVTIPVVVHVVHLGENEGLGSNISTGQIVGAMNKLNQNFRTANGINTGIQFCLAQVDPDGASTNGITRTDGRVVAGYQSEGIGGSSSPTGLDIIEIKNLIQWPTDEYYNIHVVHEVQNASAFAYYPQNQPFFRDGTTIEAFQMNNFFSTLTHELGHAFNLRHTFNGDNNGASCPSNNDCENEGDFICDTDPHKRTDCFFGNPCISGSSPNWPNTWKNYMSYCGTTNRFTALQKDRMRIAALESGSRTVLWENNQSCTPFPEIDGAITSIDYPIDGIINPICGLSVEAEFTIKNEGTTTIQQFSVDYVFDDFSGSVSFSNVNLAYNESAPFTLPPHIIDPNQAVNELEISIVNINESEDENSLNDSKNIAFGVNDTCLTTGLSALLSDNISIYPNPTELGFISIKGIPNNLKLSLEIVDVAGRVLISKEQVQNNEKIDIQELSKGVCFIILRNENEVFSKKLLRL